MGRTRWRWFSPNLACLWRSMHSAVLSRLPDLAAAAYPACGTAAAAAYHHCSNATNYHAKDLPQLNFQLLSSQSRKHGANMSAPHPSPSLISPAISGACSLRHLQQSNSEGLLEKRQESSETSRMNTSTHLYSQGQGGAYAPTPRPRMWLGRGVGITTNQSACSPAALSRGHSPASA